MLRMIVALVLAMGTSACAVVSSERPLFTAADSVGAPVLRPGLWAAIEPACKFNPRSPAASWPKCVSAVVVGPSTLVDVKRSDDPSGSDPTVQTYRLAAGDPVVVQIQTPPEPGAFYYGLRPMASDGQGRITNVRFWYGRCEAPIPAGQTAKKRKLLAGLYPIKGQEAGCLARTPAAVRNAVRLSEAWAFEGGADEAGGVVRWIRDGDR
ncbi:hypothetical protein [Phenylobacterium sp.]|uniref:hypothetical protein n=1 Tax=Phenylobacterium sp. TaxID=1871053 RepID=UPI003BA9CE04